MLAGERLVWLARRGRVTLSQIGELSFEDVSVLCVGSTASPAVHARTHPRLVSLAPYTQQAPLDAAVAFPAVPFSFLQARPGRTPLAVDVLPPRHRWPTQRLTAGDGVCQERPVPHRRACRLAGSGRGPPGETGCNSPHLGPSVCTHFPVDSAKPRQIWEVYRDGPTTDRACGTPHPSRLSRSLIRAA